MSSVRLDDGFSTIITLENLPSVHLYEKDVTPPGMSGGGATDTTTMRNTSWRTMSPKSLKTLTPLSATVAFATDAIPDLFDQINVLQLITVTFPDDATLHFYGWIDTFALGKFAEGEQPTATLTIQPANHDSSGTESAPGYNTTSSNA